MTSVTPFRRLELLAVVTLATLLAWKGIWVGWHTLGTDFPQYYVVARLMARHFCLDRIYDWVWLQRAADHAGVTHQLVGFSGLTPFSALPITPLIWLPVLAAKRVWIMLNLGLLVILIHLLRKHTGLPLLRTWLIGLLAAIPLRTSFAFGQMHLVVCALLIAAWCLHLRGRQLASGCCIAIAGALKIYPLFYCLYFLMKRRWRALAAVVLLSVVCLMLCYAIFGRPAVSAYLAEQLPRTLQGEGNNPFLASATSASAMFHRLFLIEPELNPHPLVSSVWLYATLYPLWQASLAALVLPGIRPGPQSRDRETLEWCAFLTLLLFLSSAPASYHFVTLIAAAGPTYAFFWRKQRLAGAAFLLVYVVACNAWNIVIPNPFSPGNTVTLVPKLWAGVGLIFVYAWLLLLKTRDDAMQGARAFPPPSNPGEPPSQKTRPYSIAVVIIAAIWLGGFLSTRHHLRSISNDNSRKLVMTDHAWLRGTPRATSAGLYYLAMLDTGYRVMRDGTPIDASVSVDELSFAVDREGRELWVEFADPNGSHITRATQAGAAFGRCVINDAESPALAADGSALAFIRENRGHGSLWIISTQSCGPAGPGAVRVTPESMDVRAINSSPEGKFIVSAITAHGASVFNVSPTGVMERLLQSPTQLGSSEISADGNHLLVSQLIANRWQLAIIDLLRHSRRQITFSDCNSQSPVWKDSRTILYATDCERGNGLNTLARIRWEE